ncbi:IucA/IucC family siderophore biosynthesis protein, partial [Streptomyces sp. SID7982]|nr:IucA/IucC family siderophore biosynthesis protein [Streptomyces sp. SID7982]
PVPVSGTGGLHRLTLDDGGALVFTARRGVYGSWRVDPESIEITAQPQAAQADGSPAARADVQSNGSPSAHAAAQSNGSPAASRPFRDPLTFLTRARDLLGLDGTTLGHLIRELTLTLSADARLDHTALTADRLADLDYAELEGHQTGHPWLVASKGRLGFSAADAARFTP